MFSLRTELADVYKKTNFIVEKTDLTGAISVDYQPSRAAALLAIVTDSVDGGTLGLFGKDQDNASVAETHIFSADGAYQTENLFSELTAVNATAFSSGTLEVQAVTPQGEPVESLVLLSSNVPVRISKQKFVLSLETPGLVETDSFKMFTEQQIEAKQYIAFEEQTYLVDTVSPVYDQIGVHHYESILKVVEG